MPFEIVRNDITKMNTDAIVNAANGSLLGGGGVDGAIHRAAGPKLLEECRTMGGCETGKAKITSGYNLPCRYVIHTVGPVWQGGNNGERDALASCYRESLYLAADYGCESIAFPLISSGAYGYPKDQAMRIAADTIRSFLADHEMTVYLVIYDRTSFSISRELYTNIRTFIDDAYIGPDYEIEECSRRMLHSSNLLRPAAKQQETQEMPAYRPFTGKSKKDETDREPSGRTAAAEQTHGRLNDYLKQIDEGFRDMLLRKIDERRMTDAECYKKANIDRKLFNKIKNQEGYRPGKSTVLALAISLQLPLDETREMLTKAGYSLSHSSKADLIVEFFIINGKFDIYEINEALFSFDQKLLGSTSAV